MSSSQNQSPAQGSNKSSEIANGKFSSLRQQPLVFSGSQPLPGTYDDASLIRGVLIQSIKNSGKSRIAIAEEMEFLLSRTVTEKMLNAFTAESRDDRRWPAEFDRAFCKATGDNTLLACRAELAGLHVISEADKVLLDLGRQFFIRTQADQQIDLLQRVLSGRAA